MRAIRAHGRLLAQGQYAACHPGLRYATPRAVFWRPFRARVVGSIKIPGLRLGGCAPGLRYATPWAVFWRPFRARVVGSIEWGAHRDFRARVEMSNI